MELTARNRLFSGGSSAGRLLRRELLAAVLAAVANALVLGFRAAERAVREEEGQGH